MIVRQKRLPLLFTTFLHVSLLFLDDLQNPHQCKDTATYQECECDHWLCLPEFSIVKVNSW